MLFHFISPTTFSTTCFYNLNNVNCFYNPCFNYIMFSQSANSKIFRFKPYRPPKIKKNLVKNVYTVKILLFFDSEMYSFDSIHAIWASLYHVTPFAWNSANIACVHIWIPTWPWSNPDSQHRFSDSQYIHSQLLGIFFCFFLKFAHIT